MFGYIRKSKVLDIIETKRRSIVEDIESLDNIRTNNISFETNKDKNDYLCKSAFLEGKYEILIKLTEKIVKDGM